MLGRAKKQNDKLLKMARRLTRIRHQPKRAKPIKQGQKLSTNPSWLLLGLAWATTISFFLTVPPQFWWQIVIGLFLIFVSLFLSINITSHKQTFSLVITSLIILLPILRLVQFLTLTIGLLIVWSIILLTGYFLLEKN